MYKLLLIWRYFIKKRVALLAVLAVMLVVMMVLVVLSVMSGLLEDTRDKNHQWSGDVIISRDSLVGFPDYQEFLDKLQQLDSVAVAAPVIRTFGLLNPDGFAVQLIGVHLPEFCTTTGFQHTLHRLAKQSEPTFTVAPGPRWNNRTTFLSKEQKRRGCIIGRYMFGSDYEPDDEQRAYLAAQPLRFGVTVFGFNSRGALMGSDVGEYQIFWYVDDSDSGLPDVDAMTIYVDFDELQRLCFMDGSYGEPARINEIRIKLADGIALERGRQAIATAWATFLSDQNANPTHGPTSSSITDSTAGSTTRSPTSSTSRLFSDVKVQTWQEYRRGGIVWAENERRLVVVVFCMISVVAVFVVFAIFYMIVSEKIKDLGIIKSVGGSRWGLAQIFLGFGTLVGLVGAMIGTVLGVHIVWYSNEIEAVLTRLFGFRLWDPSVYAIDRIPDVVDYNQATMIALAAVVASVIGAALPARRAARLEVIDALRVE